MNRVRLVVARTSEQTNGVTQNVNKCEVNGLFGCDGEEEQY